VSLDTIGLNAGKEYSVDATSTVCSI